MYFIERKFERKEWKIRNESDSERMEMRKWLLSVAAFFYDISILTSKVIPLHKNKNIHVEKWMLWTIEIMWSDVIGIYDTFAEFVSTTHRQLSWFMYAGVAGKI